MATLQHLFAQVTAIHVASAKYVSFISNLSTGYFIEDSKGSVVKKTWNTWNHYGGPPKRSNRVLHKVMLYRTNDFLFASGYSICHFEHHPYQQSWARIQCTKPHNNQNRSHLSHEMSQDCFILGFSSGAVLIVPYLIYIECFFSITRGAMWGTLINEAKSLKSWSLDHDVFCAGWLAMLPTCFHLSMSILY